MYTKAQTSILRLSGMVLRGSSIANYYLKREHQGWFILIHKLMICLQVRFRKILQVDYTRDLTAKIDSPKISKEYTCGVL